MQTEPYNFEEVEGREGVALVFENSWGISNDLLF